jgi:hypothetical protein
MSNQETGQPLLREWNPAGFWQEWYGEVPPLGVKYRIHPGGDEWDTVIEGGRQVPVRRIYEIELIEDVELPG